MNNNQDWVLVENKKHKFNSKNINNNRLNYNCDYDKNQKKLLCNNMLKYNKCSYNDKCMYAHNIEEQNVEYYKKKAYDIIKSNSYVNIDLSKDYKLANTFKLFTKICPDCVNKTCPGGYNCKFGVIDEKYIICYNDLMYGNCKKYNCTFIHLTNRGISPIISYHKNNDTQVLDDNFFIKLALHKKNFPVRYISDDDDEESKEITQEIINYLDNHDSDEECDRSIFIEKID